MPQHLSLTLGTLLLLCVRTRSACVGQAGSTSIDFAALSGLKFSGQVASNSSATGSSFTFQMCAPTERSTCGALAVKIPGWRAPDCFVASQWLPEVDPVTWDSIASGAYGLIMTVSNGDICDEMPGEPINAGIVVSFTCGVTLGPEGPLTVTEYGPCRYAFDFPTTLACAPGPAPGPRPAPAPAASFSCGKLSCGWALIIASALASALGWTITLAINLARKKTGLAVLPLVSAIPKCVTYFGWGLMWSTLWCGCGKCGQSMEFRCGNCHRCGLALSSGGGEGGGGLRGSSVGERARLHTDSYQRSLIQPKVSDVLRNIDRDAF